MGWCVKYYTTSPIVHYITPKIFDINKDSERKLLFDTLESMYNPYSNLMKYYRKSLIAKYLLLLFLGKNGREQHKIALQTLDKNRINEFQWLKNIFIKRMLFSKIFYTNDYINRLVLRLMSERQLVDFRRVVHQVNVEKRNWEESRKFEDCDKDWESMRIHEAYCRKHLDENKNDSIH